ncbi:dipeptidyl aminopeptidase/acylaminoacyl peptidase [Kribbella voronezhensis]|uniref:Dipeptidyl aminopeptidase/acylaminoacyl peptidase n=1 Tax=Kribbella voronezhensis TaxID=2512212 RepID=A0A4V3FKC3_9ACTN|nr:alpha/beta fold hydrolase [Kribbella voronezhensis]TDU89683.1 dipeptidyl aminopeptidase/acylaminoacyl peptidase [Kribbella voronezhensis]
MLTTLLSLPTVMAFDVDSEGRLLIAYDGSGIRQLHEIGRDGSWRTLTDLADTVRGARYIPGARRAVIEHDTDGNERGQLSLLDLEADGLPELVPLVQDPAYLHRLIDARPDRVLFSTNRRNDVDFDLVARDLATGADTVLYDGGGFMGPVAVSPDDRWALILMAGGPGNSVQLLLVETTTQAVTELTAFDAPNCQDSPSWLPDSSGFVISSDADRDRMALRRFDLATGSWSDLLVDDQRDLAGWSCPDGEHLLVGSTEDGEVSLALHSLADGALVAPIDLPGGGLAARQIGARDPLWSEDGSHAVINYTSPVQPPVVVRYTRETGGLLTVEAPDMPELPAGLAHPESHRVPSSDGEQVPVFVYRPADGGDGSAVIHIHGGPEAAAMRSWNAVIAGLVADGHTVVVPNVRGSAAYGRRWYSLDDKRLRLDSVADLAAIHAWLPSIGVDQSRVALFGGSYGGYMVLAGLAFQPTLWAAGVDIVGIASLVTFLENTSDYRRAVREREYGTLADDRDFLAEASPLNRVDDIRAPLFVIHGANDPRVPLSEAEQIAEALAKRDIPCQLLVYSDEGHGLAKRQNRLDAYPKAFAFLAEHLAQSGK